MTSNPRGQSISLLYFFSCNPKKGEKKGGGREGKGWKNPFLIEPPSIPDKDSIFWGFINT